MIYSKIAIEKIAEGYHPRKDSNEKDELKQSIQREGRLLDPITVREEGDRFIIIDGRRRLRAVKELGWIEIDCVIEGVDERTAAHLSFIKNTERKNLNPIDIANHLRAMLDHFGYNVEDLVRLGYAPHRASLDNYINLLKLPEDIQGLISTGAINKTCGFELARLDDPEVQLKIAEEIATKKNTSTRKVKETVNSLIAARNRKEEVKELPIFKGEIPGVFFKDSRDMSELQDQSVHLILTSPAYGVGLEYEEGVSLDDHIKMIEGVFSECSRVLVSGGIIFLNFGDIHNYGTRNGGRPEIFKMGPHYLEILRKHGIRLTDEITWEKNSNWVNNQQVSYSDRVRHTSYRILNNTEHLWIFRKDGERNVPVDLEYQSKITKDEWKEWVNGVWKINAIQSQKDHPAQFPEELVGRAIRMFSYKGDKVLDPFLGSGTTVKVACELGRVGIGYEKEEKYKSIIMKKLGTEVIAGETQSIDMDQPETLPATVPATVRSPFDGVITMMEKLTRSAIELGRDVHEIKSVTASCSPVLDINNDDLLVDWHEDPDDDPDDDGSNSPGGRKLCAKNTSLSVKEPVQAVSGTVSEGDVSVTGDIQGLDTILHADCLERLKGLPENSVDLLVTDPPYGLKFMGKNWDKATPDFEIWQECYRVLKPGAFAFIMASSRQDLLYRMYAKLEEAGFNTGFTSLYWTYATGFTKAHNIEKKIEKKQGSEPKGVTGSTTDEVNQLSGAYAGFQPKPALEPIIVVMKPCTKKSYVDEALATGKGITWLDKCRIPNESKDTPAAGHRTATFGTQETIPGGNGSGNWSANSKGRFPANLLVSDDVLDADENLPVIKKYSRFFSLDAWAEKCLPFLIVPKPNRPEKEMGLDEFQDKMITGRDPGQDARKVPHKTRSTSRKNTHPTVKPVKLMAYLITMGSRQGDVVLDPFAGSGTTCMAAKTLGRHFIGMEMDEEYVEIATRRVQAVTWEEPVDIKKGRKSKKARSRDKKSGSAVPKPDEVKVVQVSEADEKFMVCNAG
ncbi:MAG: ParB/RepB/Spo0J family partition protein [Deltaproteobacteria bacterium]|nr:ParB/RepB/Spo0J family partition protein [Deltaproteobacteria bacterium]